MLWKKTIIMLIAFGVTTVAAIAAKSIPQGQTGPSLDLPAVAADQITKLVVDNAGGELIIEKTGDDWKIMPGEYPVEQRTIESALNMLSDLKGSTMISKSSANHARYGVGDAGIKVAVHTDKGALWELIVGEQSPDNRGNYVRKPDDDKVFISSKKIQTLLKKDMYGWRDRTIVKFDAESANKLDVALLEGKLSFIKDENGKWVFKQQPQTLPADYRLDSNKVMGIVRALSNLSATNFEDEVTDHAALGLDAPPAKVSVELEGGEKIAIALGKGVEENRTPIIREGHEQIYYLTDYSVKKFKKGLEDLRDMRVASFDAAKASKIEITKEDFTLSFNKTQDWTLGDHSEQVDQDFTLDPQKVAGLARSLANLQSKEILGKTPPADAGLSNPAGQITVTMEDGTQHKVVVGNNKDDKETYLQGTDGTVYIAGKPQAARLLHGVEHYKVMAKRQMPMINPEQLKNLPPEVVQQLMAKQRQQIQQRQMMKNLQQQQQGQ